MHVPPASLPLPHDCTQNQVTAARSPQVQTVSAETCCGQRAGVTDPVVSAPQRAPASVQARPLKHAAASSPQSRPACGPTGSLYWTTRYVTHATLGRRVWVDRCGDTPGHHLAAGAHRAAANARLPGERGPRPAPSSPEDASQGRNRSQLTRSGSILSSVFCCDVSQTVSSRLSPLPELRMVPICRQKTSHI